MTARAAGRRGGVLAAPVLLAPVLLATVLLAAVLMAAVGCGAGTSLPADTDVPAVPPSAQATAPTPTVVSEPRYVFPVDGPDVSYADVHHDYPAADIFAPCGAVVRAPTGGTVVDVVREDRWAAGDRRRSVRGGRSVTLVGDDGVRYYGSHLDSVAADVRPGGYVRAGAVLGRVGESGNAAGTGCHLHLGISPVCGRDADWWVRRGAVPPYPFLRAWQRGTPRSPADAVAAWERRHGCADAPPPGY